MHAEEEGGAPRDKLMFRFFGPGEEKIRRANIQECFYMIPIDNLRSVLQNGLLSHRRIEKERIERRDVSNQAVQARRAEKIIERVDQTKRPRSLHRFVNLYLNPHNAMMMNIIHGREGVAPRPAAEMCVLRISGEILDRGDAVLTDQNAATGDANFYTADAFEMDARRTAAMTLPEPTGYKTLKKTGLFQGESDASVSIFKKQTRQAEVLVPYKVDPRYLFGIWVYDDATGVRVAQILQGVERRDVTVGVNRALFLPSQYEPLNNYTPRVIEAGAGRIEAELPESDESNDEGTENAIALKRPKV